MSLSYRLTPPKLLSIHLYVFQEVSAVVDFHIAFPKVFTAVYHVFYTHSFTLPSYSLSTSISLFRFSPFLFCTNCILSRHFMKFPLRGPVPFPCLLWVLQFKHTYLKIQPSIHIHLRENIKHLAFLV